MDTSKIIKGVVNSGRYTVTAPIIKEDYGLYLQIEGVELPETYQVDFSNSEHNGTSVTMIGNSDGVLIPHQFIDTGKDVFAFLYHVGEDFGRTVYKFRIPNKVRPDRTDEEPTPEEQSVIDQAISALNSAVAQTAQDVVDAEASAQSASQSAENAHDSAVDAQNYAESAQTSANNASASASQASTSATASANSASASAQIKADVEDLVDDAQGYAQASAQSASASANSASQAQGYAQSASASANSASGYASQADISANTASTKASEASTSAQTASTKATEASQSAENALSYKTDAESAKTASQTAQGLAESARDTAVQAKTDAESAKADAESARDEAQSAVASISGALDDKAPVITDTASGAIASFSDGADNIPLKSLVVDINPIQDLSHGDPSPENLCPISGWTEVDVEQRGKNLVSAIPQNIVRHNGNPTIICDEDNTVTIKAQQVAAYDACFYAMTITESMVGLSVTVSAKEFKQGCPRITKFPHGNYSILPTDVTNSDIHVRTITQDDVGYDFAVRVYNDSGADLTFEQLQLELGATATPYSPYTGRSITINLGQTVYGGKLDVLSGELVIDMAMVDLGTLDWTLIASRFQSNSLIDDIKTSDTDYSSFLRCSILNPNNSPITSQTIDGTIATYNKRLYALASMYADATEFKTAMSGQQLCYELAEPIEIQLSPNQLNSLYGVNNLWADSGDTTCVYRADTKAYIAKKIAEALASLT